ncbi:hypothetical protein [Saccharolobus sp.]|uniref:hypothetical protein n=2 Tax=Saccharolobus sp. TaxID=2100761 RepID=UPI0031726505
MFVSHYSSSSPQSSLNDVGAMLLKDLRCIVVKVKKLRKWYLVSRLTRAFIRSCLLMRLETVKSLILMKAIVKTIKELKEIISEEAKLIRMGLSEAWKISELASKWGHSSSRSWKSNKYFIIYQALTLKWIKKLFGLVLSN